MPFPWCPFGRLLSLSLGCRSFLGRTGLHLPWENVISFATGFSALVLSRCFLGWQQVWENTLLPLLSSREEAVNVSCALLEKFRRIMPKSGNLFQQRLLTGYQLHYWESNHHVMGRSCERNVEILILAYIKKVLLHKSSPRYVNLALRDFYASLTDPVM